MEPLRGISSTRGELRATPFAHLLVELLENRETGSVFVYGPGQRIDAVIRIEGGFAVRGRLEGSAEPNLMQLLIPLCARSDGGYAFEPGVDALGPVPHVATGPVDLLELVTASSRGPLREDALAEVMAVVSRNLLRLHPRGDFARYGFTAQERTVLEGLSHGPVDLVQLRMMTAAPEHVLRRVLYVLRVTHALTLLPIARTQSGTISHPPPLPQRPSTPVAATPEPPAVGINRLSLPPRPRSGPVSRAITEPIVRPRPASSSENDVSRVSAMLDAPFADEHTPAVVLESRVSKPAAPPPAGAGNARAVPPRRMRHTPGSSYSMSIPEHGTTAPFDKAPAARASRSASRPASSARAPSGPVAPRLDRTADAMADADACAVRAEQLLKAGDILSALRAAEDALRQGSTKAQHEALYAWILYVQSGGGERVHPRAWEHIEHALRRDPLCASAHHYKGLMLKRMGRADEALWHFRRATQISPEHIEAARELRLHEMRKRQNQPSANVVQRLFKRLGKE